MKDNFSANPDQYLRYRPGYPDAFFDHLNKLQTQFENAWDCATGNGQVAVKLAAHYKNVYASDISQAQLGQAEKADNIHYSVQSAEQTNFEDSFFDLIIVAQSVHWFDFDRFYAEVKRTARNGALFAIIGYARLRISPELDRVVDHLYLNILGPYWDKERRYLDEHYRTIPFPFQELQAPSFPNTYEWTLEHLTGYLHTWSAVGHYKEEKGSDPVELVEHELKGAWGKAEKRRVEFPMLLRMGRIRK